MDDSSSAEGDNALEKLPVLPSERKETNCVPHSRLAVHSTSTHDSDEPGELVLSVGHKTLDARQRPRPNFTVLASGFMAWLWGKVKSWLALLRSCKPPIEHAADANNRPGQHVDSSSGKDHGIPKLSERGKAFLRLYIEVRNRPGNDMDGRPLYSYVLGAVDARSGAMLPQPDLAKEDIACLPIKIKQSLTRPRNVYAAHGNNSPGQHDDFSFYDDDSVYTITESGQDFFRLFNEMKNHHRNVMDDDALLFYALGVQSARSGVLFPHRDLASFEVVSSASPANCCIICLENYEVGDDLKTLPCLHKFHQACIDEWLLVDRECPACKEVVEDSEVVED